MKSVFLMAGMMMVSASVLAFEGAPKENNPPGVVETESEKGVNIYRLDDGDEFGYASPLTIAPGNSSFRSGTLVDIQNRGTKPTTVNVANTNLSAPLAVPGKSNAQFKFDGGKWESMGVRLESDPLPSGARPSGQQKNPPASN
ncbi:hypothetical protein DJ564_06190 [Pseudomonas sp. 31-12]|uniref:hypothetical protein n=1 Tax=Pseudomonas sp. 31-12 TaxID=2201356 RepID=UPI000D6D774C|nr:hypothetical protein [Pseudomonas sp. 31-12]AWM90437.1 hypothetical protein DJ564_06190 [Pseudomonas sp. 31-12]